MDPKNDKYLHKLYYNPQSKVAFGGVDKLWRHIRSSGRKITRRQLNEWLSKQDVYTSHHPILRRFARKRIITRGIDDIWDADLMDMTNLAEFNDGTSFLCIFIDIFSRQLIVIPMKNKSTNETLRAFKKAMKESQSQPETLRTDAGKEFLGSQVRDYLADREIYQQIAKNEHKANYAERVIRTLKKKIYKYLYSNKTQRYIDVLQDLVDGYNNSFHSGIKCSPSSVTKDNQHTVWVQQYMSRKGNIKPPTQFQFQVGDLVRISNIRTPFSRGFGQTFSEELFHIQLRFPGTPVTYLLKDLKGETISGLFYEPELVKVTGKNRDTKYSVEKILDRRTRRGKKQVLIKWKGYSDSFNSWEPIENLQ